MGFLSQPFNSPRITDPAASSDATAGAPTVLVTGAARRIGREIALELARHGWRVAVHCRSNQAQAAETASDCAQLAGDSAIFAAELGDEVQARALVPAVVARFGRLDAVVNSASTFQLDDAQDFSLASLDRHMHANVGAPVLLSQALHQHLEHSGRKGCVVNLLDQKLWNVNPDFLSYSLSKSALHMATAMLAQRFAPRMRVAAVAPGLTYPSYLQSETDFARAARFSLLGETSSAQDVARAVRFLIETPSITGATLLVDAGQHLTPLGRDVSFL